MFITKKRLSDLVRAELENVLREVARKRPVGRPEETPSHKRKVRADWERKNRDKKWREKHTKSLKKSVDAMTDPLLSLGRGIVEEEDESRQLLLNDLDPELATEEDFERARMMQVADVSPLDKCNRLIAELETIQDQLIFTDEKKTKGWGEVLDDTFNESETDESVEVSLSDKERQDALYDKAKGMQQCQQKVKDLKQDLMSKVQRKCPFSFEDYVRMTRIAKAAEKLKEPFEKD